MSDATFVLAINLIVAGLFAAAFLVAAGYDKTRSAARLFALAYVAGMSYFCTEGLVPVLGASSPLEIAGFASFLAAVVVNGYGIAAHYRQRLPAPTVAAFCVCAVILNIAAQDLPRESLARLSIYQAPYALVELAAALIVARSIRRRGLDRALFVLLVATALNFMIKPLLAVHLGAGDTASDYLGSIYALVSQSMGTVLGIATGLLLLGLLVRDIIAEITEKSETDTLCGLFNRRGFEEHVRDALKRIDRTRRPAVIVIADLDRFKEVNDTFGHAAGDRAIGCFADRLRLCMPDGSVAGRIGGEEFAIVLPGLDAAAGRLFAETVRANFASNPVRGLPPDYRMTASFGVAALKIGDTISDMLRRADIALYDAKNSGRDRVRVFTESPLAAARVLGPDPMISSLPPRLYR